MAHVPPHISPFLAPEQGLLQSALPNPVEVGLGVTAPALPAVLGRDELGTLAVFRAFLHAHREPNRVRVSRRASMTAARSRWVRGGISEETGCMQGKSHAAIKARKRTNKHGFELLL